MTSCKIASLIVAAIYIVAAVVIRHPASDLKSVLAALLAWLTLSLSAIWFGDALGDLARSESPGPVGPQVRKTPRGLIPIFGWIFLALPLLWFIAAW